MSDLPVLKTQRYRDERRANSDRTKRVAEAFFVPGPNAEKYPNGADAFRCPAGPGMASIPKEGRWYDVTTYLLKCVRSGDAAEGSPPTPAKEVKNKPAPKADPKMKE